MTLAPSLKPTRGAIASPSVGSPFGSKVWAFGRIVHQAVDDLLDRVTCDSDAFVQIFAPRLPRLGFGLPDQDPRRRIAWALVSMWLCGYAKAAFDAATTVAEAEEWFTVDLDTPRLAPPGETRALKALGEAASPVVTHALLPYLLDPHRLGTRRHVIRSPESRPQRLARKALGVFYTPADVAQTMINEVLQEGRWLDPACGTGVFLREARDASPESVAFGIDIDPQSVEAATFVLTADAIGEEPPLLTWHRERMHVAVADSTRLRRAEPVLEAVSTKVAARVEVIQQLDRGVLPDPAREQTTPVELAEIFPDLLAGADVVITNPPYTRVPRAEAPSATVPSECDHVRSGPEVFPTFVDLAFDFSSPSGVGCLVTPLSIAYSSTPQMQALRGMIEGSCASWRFRFFDRAPDALFGDDVKTRNAIVTFAKGRPAAVKVSEFSRWSGASRRQFLQRAPSMVDVSGIRHVVPKFGSETERALYESLHVPGTRLVESVVFSRTSSPAANDDRATLGCPVAIGPTAYNWLNCVRNPASLRNAGHTAQSRFTEFFAGTERSADALYAVLASRLTYWLWRVEGDGFHVPHRFLADLPYPAVLLNSDRLSELGRELWDQVSLAPAQSVNGSRVSVAFRPTGEDGGILDRIEAEMLIVLSVDAGFSLREWHHGVVWAGREPAGVSRGRGNC